VSSGLCGKATQALVGVLAGNSPSQFNALATEMAAAIAFCNLPIAFSPLKAR
jgi:hypothetical protein